MKKTIFIMMIAILALSLCANYVHVNVTYRNLTIPTVSGSVSADYDTTAPLYDIYIQGTENYTFNFWNVNGATTATGKAVLNGRSDSDTVPYGGVHTYTSVCVNLSPLVPVPINPPAQD